MINQDEIFGNTTKAFSVETLMKYSKQDKNSKDFKFTKTKNYFLSYFAKSFGDTRYFYEPQEEGDGLIESLTKEQAKTKIEQIPVIYYNQEGDAENDDNEETKKSKKFNLAKWFIEQHHTTYSISSDPRSSRFFESKKTGRKFINLSKGFLHKNAKKFNEYSDKQKKNVELIINHIVNVWNSGNKVAGDYTLNWLAHALTGHKMETAIFLKSGEGTGKSIIVDFIIQNVIGTALGLSTSRARELMKFNAQLLGKVFLCLEELPASTKSEWFSISDFLKDLITGSSIDIEKKYSDVVQTVNLISLIIMTNNENTIKFGKDARRYHMADISHDKVGNSEYFTTLENAMTKETGEVFFAWLLERYETTKDTFNCSEVPLTESKIEMKIRNLSPLLKYVKEECIAKKTGLFDSSKRHHKLEISKLKELINVVENKECYKSTQVMNQAVKAEIPILKVVEYGKNKTHHIEPTDFQTLYDFFVKKGYWSEKFDKFETIDDEPLEEEKKIDYREMYEAQYNKTLELEAQIKKLQELLNKKEEPQQQVEMKSTKVVEIKSNKTVSTISDLDEDLRQMEEEEARKTKLKVKKVIVIDDGEEIQQAPKPTAKQQETKKSVSRKLTKAEFAEIEKQVVIQDEEEDDIQFEIKPTSKLTNFFN